MQVKATKLIQNGQILYLTKLDSKTLIGLTKVDDWNPDIKETDTPIDQLIKKQGYQRSPIRDHYTKVGKYLATYKDALLPTAILLNSRKQLNFEEEDTSNQIGILDIPEKEALYIVDGQHRIYGIEYAINELNLEEIKSFPLPVIIIDNAGKEEEVRHFYIVNSTQKKVRTDLAERLLSLLARKDPRVLTELKEKDRAWKLRAVKIADILGNDPESSWHRRIKRPNQASSPETVASEGSFTTSLKPVLKSEFALNEDDNVVFAWIKSFWKSLEELMPEAFEEPKKFVIQKTPGMYTLHMVFPYILYECTKAQDYSQEKMREILKRDSDHCQNAEFWASGGEGAALYNSVGAFKILSNAIREILMEGTQ